MHKREMRSALRAAAAGGGGCLFQLACALGSLQDTRVFLKPCAPDSGSGGSGGGVARPLDDQGRLLLDARTTLADEACLLPVVVQ